MDKKIYTAFISSTFSDLQKERKLVIDCLLDRRVMPICMEHFATSSDEELEDIYRMIDDSDFVIVLLGAQYGSCRIGDVSCTQKEYDYALRQKKKILCIKCESFEALLKKEKSELSEEEKKQLEFGEKIVLSSYASVYSIDRILTKFLPPYRLARFPGWTRNVMSDTELEKWKEENAIYHVAGKWYHVHLKETEEGMSADENKEKEKYIRVGSVEITQEFTPERYTKFKMVGNNYDAVYDVKRKEVNCEGNYSSFSGEYTLDTGNNKIVGIYSSQRMFQVGKQLKYKRGIHELDVVKDEDTVWINGTFQDAAPSESYGVIVLFRTKEERNKYVIKHRGRVVKRKQGE